MRLDIKKKNVLALPKTASRLVVRSYKNISSVDFDVRPLQRIHYLLIATLVLAPTLSTLYLELRSSKLYALTKEEKSIVASTSVKKELIKTTEDAYTYNRKEELKGVPNGSDPKLQELLLSANKTDSTGKEPYQASLSKDPTKGLTFGDAEGNRQFTLTPNFGLSEAKLDDESRVVYPVSTTERSIYTFKKNGIKNDITLLEAPSADPNTNGTTKTYKYTLNLGKDLEAKLLPSGDVGIYSADPTLFGNIQVGDQKSQELVDQARNNGEKNTLAFEIPKPFIIDSSKKMNYDDVSFKLEPNQKDPTKPTLILELKNLKNLPYPLSIDPTITVTTTNDFLSNTGDTGNIDFSTSGQITRGTIGSGALGSAWASPTAFSTARGYQSTVVANGFMYVIGGCTSGGCSAFSNNIQIGTLNSSGGVTAWASSTFNTGRISHVAVAYNNYLYIIGGQQANADTACNTSNSFYCRDVQYATINPTTGTIGTWLYTFNSNSCATLAVCAGGFPSSITSPGIAVYNGYIYTVGGFNGSVNIATVQYAPINANGTIGTWTATTANPVNRTAANARVYNGYIYVTGGSDGATYHNSVAYAPINANGTIGTWTTSANTFTTGRTAHGGEIYGGYIYIVGGQNSSGSDLSDVQFAPINSDGSVGGWGSTTSISATLRYANMTYYNGYMFVTGGLAGGSYSTYIRSIQIGAGAPGVAVASGNNLAALRGWHSSVAYNGFLYVIGGFNGSAPNIYADVYYSAIATNGTIGTWASTTSLPSGRYSASATVYNGYMYVIGGCTAGVCTSYTDDILYALICTGSNNGVSGCGVTAGTVGTWNSYLPTGGTVTNFIGNGTIGTNGVGYRVHTFATGGTLDMKAVSRSVDYVIVGGGGASGGSQTTMGGGGGGQVQTGTVSSSSNTTVTIGGAGSSSSTTGAIAVTAVAGSNGTANGGASGGGNAGGTGINYCGGGGGGAGSAGSNYTLANCPAGSIYIGPGSGGAGVANTITGASLTYAGGGGGVGRNDNVNYQPASNGSCTSTYGCGGQATPLTTFISTGAGTTGAAIFRYTTPFTARFGHTSFVHNGYLYVVGGKDANIVKNDIYYALICTGSNSGVGGCGSTAGMLGTWVQNANSLISARQTFQTIVYNGYVYVIGGNNGAGPIASVEYASIGNSGAIGALSATTSLPAARSGHVAIVYGGYIYVAGGNLDTTASAQSTIYYSRINSLGGLQDWQTTSNLSSARYAFSGAVYNGFVYFTGGYNGSVFLQDNYYALIGSQEGRAGTTTQQANVFTQTRHSHKSVVYNGYIYIIGGWNGGGIYYNDIQKCLINSDATVTCSSGGSFTTNRSAHSSVAYNGYLYIIGGWNGTYQNDIQYCPIFANGNIDTCKQETNAFTNSRAGHSSVAYNGYLYIIGGTNGSSYYNDIQYCPIISNGSVGVCTQQTNAFASPRILASDIYNGYIYIVGGEDGAGKYNDIQYCPINSNGSVGVCTQQTNAFLTARNYHSINVYNGNLYIIGGGYPSPNSDIQYCPINPNGSVGICMQQISAFINARYSHTSIVYAGYLYIIGGGNSAGTPQNDIQRLPISSINQSAIYERTIDTGSSANTIGSFVILGSAPCTYRVSYATAGSTNAYGATATLYSVPSGSNVAVSAASSRYLRVSIALDDSACQSNSSTITDLVIYYNDTPNAPTLNSPSSGATNVSTLPEFRLASTDENPYQKYFRYKIEVCSTSNCSSIVRTIDQTSSQTGWLGQSQAGGTAYAAGASIFEYAIHKYQAAALSNSTQYWWRGYTIDPEGSNTWSSASAISTFTTEASSQANTVINGGATIYGGSNVY